MPPLNKEIKNASQEDVKGFIDAKEQISDHNPNGPVGTCQAPHPMDRIVWKNVIIMSYLHLVGLYGIYLCFTSAQWKTVIAGE